MSRSKASAALLRLKEIDKKYRLRYEEPKQEELSSDNTESLLPTPVKSKNNTPPASATEDQEILKPTLSIKIPDTFTEPLESQSLSNKALPSVRVSIVNKTPIIDPKIESQSISEIEEELEDGESISELLDDSDNSGSGNANKSPNEESEKSNMKNGLSTIEGNNVFLEKKQLENYVSELSDAHSIVNYSHCSFESYSSVYKSQSKSASESDIHEANISLSAQNINRNEARFSSKGTFDTRIFAEDIEKKNEKSSAKFAQNIEKKEEVFAKFANGTVNKHEEASMKLAEIVEKKTEEITAEFAGSVEKDNKTVTSKDIDKNDQEVEELSKSVDVTDLFRTISGDSEGVTDAHKILSFERNKRKDSKIEKQENQEKATKDKNLSNIKLPEDKSRQRDFGTGDKQELRKTLLSSSESLSSSQRKSEKNISTVGLSKINDEVQSVQEFSYSNVEILSRKKSKQHRKKLKDRGNGNLGTSGKSTSSLSDTNPLITKSSRNRNRTINFAVADKSEEEDLGEISSSVKEDFPHRKLGNSENALFSRKNRTKHASSQLLRGSKRYIEKSSDYSEGVGKMPTMDDGVFESRSRQISSERKYEHCNLALRQTDAEKRFSKTVQKSQSATEIRKAKEQKNSTDIGRKKFHQDSKVYGCIKKTIRGAKTSKSSTFCRVNETRHARKDMELERFNMRLMDLRLEQERQLMLCNMRNFEENRERLLLWPDRFYCAGKPEAATIKPLNFQNVVKFAKPDSNAAKVGLTFPENHLTMLKDRVVEIRQWLKDQFILYQSYSDVAAAINAKYVNESEKVGIMMQSKTFGIRVLNNEMHKFC